MATPQFNPKNFYMITASMVNWMANHQDKIRDFNVGAVTRTMLESVAVEMEEFYFRVYQALGKAIDDAIYNAFDFPRLPATYATGDVRFTRQAGSTGNISIPVGRMVSTPDGKLYIVIEVGAFIPSGNDFADVSVRATSPGPEFNVPVNSVDRMTTPIAGVASAANSQKPISGGSGEETDINRRARFNLFIQSLARATNPALEFAAKSVAGVVVAKALDSQVVYALHYEAGDDFGDPFTDRTEAVNTPHEQIFPMFDAGGGDSFAVGSSYQMSKLYADMAEATTAGTPGTWMYWSSNYDSLGNDGWLDVPLGAILDDSTNSLSMTGSLELDLDYVITPSDPGGGWLAGRTFGQDWTFTDRDGTYGGFFLKLQIAPASPYTPPPGPRCVQLFTKPEPGETYLFASGENGILTAQLTGSATVVETLALHHSAGPGFHPYVLASQFVGSVATAMVTPDPINYWHVGNSIVGKTIYLDDSIDVAHPGGGVNVVVTYDPGDLGFQYALSPYPAGQREEIESLLDDYRGSGIKVTVVKPQLKSVDLSVTVSIDDRFSKLDMRDAIQGALANYTSGIGFGGTIKVSELIQFIMNLQDVAITGLTIETMSLDGKVPAQDVVAPANQYLMMGTVTVTVI